MYGLRSLTDVVELVVDLGGGAHAFGVDEAEPGWRPGDTLYVDLPDGQTVRGRIVDILEDGTVQVVSEHPVTIT